MSNANFSFYRTVHVMINVDIKIDENFLTYRVDVSALEGSDTGNQFETDSQAAEKIKSINK